MSVAYVGTSNSGQITAGPSSFQWTHDSGTSLNRCLIVFVQMQAGVSISSVTYNSVGMTLVREISMDYAPIPRVAMYQLVNPASGENTVLVTLSGALTSDHMACAGALSFSGVDQISPIRDETYQSYGFGEGQANYELIVNSVNGDHLVAGVLTETQPGYSLDGTSRWQITIRSGYAMGATKTAAIDANATEIGWTFQSPYPGGIVLAASLKSHVEGNAPFYYMAGGDY